MITPLVCLGGSVAVGFLALWITKPVPLDLGRPLRTKNGNGVRILTSHRLNRDSYPLVAAVAAGDREVINVYTREGIYGGTLWLLADHQSGALLDREERDTSNLRNVPEPVGGAGCSVPPQVSGWLRTGRGGRVHMLAQGRILGMDNCLVALVGTGEEQAVNLYDPSGTFIGTVVSEEEAQQGREYLWSLAFETSRDLSDLGGVADAKAPLVRLRPERQPWLSAIRHGGTALSD